LGDRPFTTCCLSHDENILFTGDTVGRVSGFDLRVMRLYGVYKGNTGSIRDMAVHPTLNMLATVGLDRIMRVFDIKTRRQLHRVYLRQRLNCVLVSSEETVEDFAEEENEEVQSESGSDESILHDDDDLVEMEDDKEVKEEEDSDDSILHDDDENEDSKESLSPEE
jgi:ribosome biogenesis protein NSA1